MKNKKILLLASMLCSILGLSTQASNELPKKILLSLENAIKEKNLIEVQRLLKHKSLNSKVSTNETILHYAVRQKAFNIIEWLLENRAHVNLQTPLITAAKNGFFSITSELINNGAKINHKNSEKQTALYWAASEGHLKIVKFLVKNGADINIQDCHQLTGLHQALRKMAGTNNDNKRKKYYNLIRFLIIKGGAQLDLGTGLWRRTTLHKALAGFSIESKPAYFLNLVKLLVLKGAALNSIDLTHKTAADMLRELALEKRIQLFKTLLPFSIEDVANERASVSNAKTFFNFAAQELNEQFFNKVTPLTFHPTTSWLPNSKLLTGGQKKMMFVLEKYYQYLFTPKQTLKNQTNLLKFKQFDSKFKNFTLPKVEELFPLVNANGIELHKKLTTFLNAGVTPQECKYLRLLYLYAQATHFTPNNPSVYKKFQDLRVTFK